MTDNPLYRSPVEGLSKERFKGGTTSREKLVTVGTSLVTLLDNDPNRVHWIMINEGANDVRFSHSPTITGISGWLLSLMGGVASMDYMEDGEAVGETVFGISSVAGNVVRVREVIRL